MATRKAGDWSCLQRFAIFFFCSATAAVAERRARRKHRTAAKPRRQLPPMNHGEEDRAIKVNRQCGVFYLVAQLSRCWHLSLQQRTHCLTEGVKMTDGAEIKMFYDGMDALAAKEQKNKFLRMICNDKPRTTMKCLLKRVPECILVSLRRRKSENRIAFERHCCICPV